MCEPDVGKLWNTIFTFSVIRNIQSKKLSSIKSIGEKGIKMTLLVLRE